MIIMPTYILLLMIQ